MPRLRPVVSSDANPIGATPRLRARDQQRIMGVEVSDRRAIDASGSSDRVLSRAEATRVAKPDGRR